MWDDPAWRPLLTEEVAVPGIESFGESAVNVRVMATTLPLKQWDVARELRLRIKRRFDAEGIQMPYPHVSVYRGRDDGAADAGMSPPAGSVSDPIPES